MPEGIQVPHEAIVRALTERYGRAMAELHQENAQLTAALEVVAGERDEYARQLQVSNMANYPQAPVPWPPAPNRDMPTEPATRIDLGSRYPDERGVQDPDLLDT